MIINSLGGQQTFPCNCLDGYCLPPPRQLSGFGQSAEAAVGASITAATADNSQQMTPPPAHPSALRSIALGVASGLLIWYITRSLDHHVFPKKREEISSTASAEE